MTEAKWTENIRLYAEEKDFEIIGKLNRCQKAEVVDGFRVYVDEGGNQYLTGGYAIAIYPREGNII